MKKVIHYFSGSGYSFLAARDLGAELGAELLPIKDSPESVPDLNGVDSVGLVFPVYHASYGLSGIPFIVERFVRSLPNLGDKYIFAVCTHGGKPGTVLRNLEKLLLRSGGKLSYGTCVRLSVQYKTDEKIRSVFMGEALPDNSDSDKAEAAELYSLWKELCPKIAIRVEERKACAMLEGYEAGVFSSVKNVLQLKMAKTRYRQMSDTDSESFEVLVNKSDAGFRVTEECVKCGLCEKLCPVNNIVIENSGPRWLGRCENCFACFHWCPRQAITGPLVEFEKNLTPVGVSAEDLF